jgi:hypothetical protein
MVTTLCGLTGGRANAHANSRLDRQEAPGPTRFSSGPDWRSPAGRLSTDHRGPRAPSGSLRTVSRTRFSWRPPAGRLSTDHRGPRALPGSLRTFRTPGRPPGSATRFSPDPLRLPARSRRGVGERERERELGVSAVVCSPAEPQRPTSHYSSLRSCCAPQTEQVTAPILVEVISESF